MSERPKTTTIEISHLSPSPTALEIEKKRKSRLIKDENGVC